METFSFLSVNTCPKDCTSKPSVHANYNYVWHCLALYRALSYTAYTAQKITYNQKNNIISIRKQKNIRKQSTARHTKSRWTPFGYDFGDTAAQARCFGTARLAVLATFVRCQLLWEISLFFIKHTGYFYRRARRGFYTLLYNSNTIDTLLSFHPSGSAYTRVDPLLAASV